MTLERDLDSVLRALDLNGEKLEDDDVAYVLSGAFDDGELACEDDFVDFAWPALSVKVKDDEERAKAIARDVHRALWNDLGRNRTEKSSTGSRAPVRLGDGWEKMEEDEKKAKATASAGARALFVNPNGLSTSDFVSTAEEKEKARAKKAGEKLAATAEVERREMFAELREARERSARSRIDGSAKTLANVDLGPFNLPNPGGGSDLIEDASLSLVPGRRYGLIGRNGKGKSTLLKHLAARRVPGIDVSYSVHYVTQEVELSAEEEELKPVDVVIGADIERRLLLEEQGRLELADDAASLARLQQVNSRLDAIGSESAPSRVSKLLKDLGFTDALMARSMKALSGGWRVRTALAAALFAQPDILFLDEPTNHLSIAAVMFLARELSTNPVWSTRIIVTVSHDRHFLDEVTTDSLHISGAAKRLASHTMAYSAWAKKRREQQLALKRRQEQRQEKIEKLKEFAGHGFRYGGSSSAINMMKKKENEAKKLELVADEESDQMADLEEDAELSLRLQAGGELRQGIVRLDEVAFAYPSGNELFSGVDLSVDSKSRIVLLGENGQGKTTMVKIITGDLEPTRGLVHRDKGARVCLVNQHHAEQLRYDKTPLAFMLDRFPGDGSYQHEQELRGHLSQCGVITELQNVPALALSGGQKSRVAMAAVSYQKPHLIILDEPTNNLDLESCEALADAIENFQGGVVLVSHDQFFVERVAREVIVIENGEVNRLESFASYKKAIAKALA